MDADEGDAAWFALSEEPIWIPSEPRPQGATVRGRSLSPCEETLDGWGIWVLVLSSCSTQIVLRFQPPNSLAVVCHSSTHF